MCACKSLHHFESRHQYLLRLFMSADCFQDISRMESELANLDSQIRMQQESVEAKNAEMKKIRDQIEQVLVYTPTSACFHCSFEVIEKIHIFSFC